MQEEKRALTKNLFHTWDIVMDNSTDINDFFNDGFPWIEEQVIEGAGKIC